MPVLDPAPLNTTPTALRRVAATGRPLVKALVDILHGPRAYRHTLLAVCPTSEAVVRAALRAADAARAPLLFAATLNQVDRDGGYTGWTPHTFVRFVAEEVERLGVDTLVVPCLDHGGPWTKDAHAADGLSLDETMAATRRSLDACLDAGYALLHIDATVGGPDRRPAPAAAIIDRTLELIAYAETARRSRGAPPLSYEVGAEEVHGTSVGDDVIRALLAGLDEGLRARGLAGAWPCFVVGNIGTALHTRTFDPLLAHRLVAQVRPYGALVKGHYTDRVATPSDYPVLGIGGANLGPELTEVEVEALRTLAAQVRAQGRTTAMEAALRAAVVRSGRWRKWVPPSEDAWPFDRLAPRRQAWLIRTGARYVWADPAVVEARAALYRQVADRDAAAFVEAQLQAAIERYLRAFNLVGFNDVLADLLPDAPLP